jgi:hypothetical protein
MNDICIVLSHDGGGSPITFVVTDPRDSSNTVVILNPGDPDATVCLEDWPCGTFVIPVTADGDPEDQTVTVSCGEIPEINVEIDCDVEGDALLTICALTEDCPVTVDVFNPFTLTTITITCTPGIEECIVLELPCGQEWVVPIYDCFGEQINEVIVECTCADPCPTPLDIQGFSRV